MTQINRPEISNNRFGSSSSRAAAHTSGWSTDDDSPLPENPSPMDIDRLRLQRKQMMKGIKLLVFCAIFWNSLIFPFFIISDQDDGLDELSKIISRQKDIAIKIGSEADTQNGNFFKKILEMNFLLTSHSSLKMRL